MNTGAGRICASALGQVQDLGTAMLRAFVDGLGRGPAATWIHGCRERGRPGSLRAVLNCGVISAWLRWDAV